MPEGEDIRACARQELRELSAGDRHAPVGVTRSSPPDAPPPRLPRRAIPEGNHEQVASDARELRHEARSLPRVLKVMQQPHADHGVESGVRKRERRRIGDEHPSPMCVRAKHLGRAVRADVARFAALERRAQSARSARDIKRVTSHRVIPEATQETVHDVRIPQGRAHIPPPVSPIAIAGAGC